MANESLEEGFQTNHRNRRSCFTLAVLLALVFRTVPVVALGPHDRRLTHGRSGISVEAPAGWTLSQHTGYADTIVFLLHPDGSRISVAATSTPLKSADALYQQNRPGLVAQGLVPTAATNGARGSISVDYTATGKLDRMRQLYFVRQVPRGQQAIVLTLVTSSKVFVVRASALDAVASNMSFDDPSSASPSTGATGARNTGSAGTTGKGGR